MVITKQKKNRRQRGHTTHGWGSMKKHRGAGSRGGRGNSGTGKRGDQKKPSSWTNNKYFGKNGFKSKSRAPKSKPVNLKILEDRSSALVAKGLMKEANGMFEVNLADLGYNKLLSTGTVTKKLKITTDFATPKAVEKISAAGGEVIVLAQKQKNQQEQKEDKHSEAEAKASEAAE